MISSEDYSIGSPAPTSGEVYSAGSPAPTSSKQSGVDTSKLAEKFLRELLKNIELMLTYANENGIVLPDDLRQKVDQLFTGSKPSGDYASTSQAAITPASSPSDFGAIKS